MKRPLTNGVQECDSNEYVLEKTRKHSHSGRAQKNVDSKYLAQHEERNQVNERLQQKRSVFNPLQREATYPPP